MLSSLSSKVSNGADPTAPMDTLDTDSAAPTDQDTDTDAPMAARTVDTVDAPTVDTVAVPTVAAPTVDTENGEHLALHTDRALCVLVDYDLIYGLVD